MGQEGVEPSTSRLSGGGGRLLAPMGANFHDFEASGAHERQPAPMGAGTVRVTVPSGSILQRRSHGGSKGLKSQPNDHVGKPYDAVMRVFVPYVTV